MYVPLKRISLKYLVLVGFLISLIPLGIFVWQSTAIQTNVSLSWQKLTDNSIESVRIAVELESLLVEVERSTKQQRILQTESISLLAENNINHYQQQIEHFCQLSAESLTVLCTEQIMIIKKLKETYLTINEQALNYFLKRLITKQSEIMNNLWKEIDYSKAQQIAIGEEKQQQVMIGLMLVSFLTFLLLIRLSSQVATHVNVLKNKINDLGKKQHHLPSKPLAFNGPKELLEINIQLDRLGSRLLKLEMLRQSFLRHASHEFKTPLASIMESCSILKDQISGPLTETQTEVVAILEDCTQSLKHLTEQLLEYNYLLQSSNPTISEIDVQRLIEEARKRYENFFLKRKQIVNIECQSPTLHTDGKLFTRIIDNLLSNAQAYGAENGTVLIKLYKDMTMNNAILLVANTGPKISEDQKINILEPFARGDVPRYDSLHGTGLGLSIVRDCVHLLDGSVAFIDIPDFDFTIKIILPLP